MGREPGLKDFILNFSVDRSILNSSFVDWQVFCKGIAKQMVEYFTTMCEIFVNYFGQCQGLADEREERLVFRLVLQLKKRQATKMKCLV